MKTLFAIALFLFTPHVLADFKQAHKDFLQGNYDQAYPQFLALAKLGQVQSQFMLGRMYEQGVGVTQSPQQAYAWFLIAKESGYYPAEAAYKQLRSMVKSKRAAKQHYQSLKRQLSPANIAQDYFPKFIQLSQITAKPKLIKQSKPELSWSLRNKPALYLLSYSLDSAGKPEQVSTLFSYPDDLAQSPIEKAFLTWRFNTEQTGRLENLSYLYLTQDKSQDLIAGLKRTLLDNMALGDSFSYYLYAEMANHGLIKELIDPAAHFLTAAVNGSLHAQFAISQCLLNGVYCQQDVAKAENWLALLPKSQQKSLVIVDALLIKQQQTKALQLLKRLSQQQDLASLIRYVQLLTTSPNSQLRDKLYARKLSRQALLLYPNNSDLLQLVSATEHNLHLVDGQ